MEVDGFKFQMAIKKGNDLTISEPPSTYDEQTAENQNGEALLIQGDLLTATDYINPFRRDAQ